MAKVKVFDKEVALHGQCHLVKKFGLFELSCHKEFTYEMWKPYL